MMLASPWTPSGPLSECPGANLNHFFYSKQLGHLQKRGHNLACLAWVLNIYINGVHQRQSMEWVSMIMNVSFQIGLLLGAPWMSVLTLSTTPIPHDLSLSNHSLGFWSSAHDRTARMQQDTDWRCLNTPATPVGNRKGKVDPSVAHHGLGREEVVWYQIPF